MGPIERKILIFADNERDADVVAEAMRDDYPHVSVCTEPEMMVAAFERVRPLVLLFASRSLKTSEAVHLALLRDSPIAQEAPHVTLVLCAREDIGHGYQLCHSDVFDDYVLFWPLAHDARRLLMSVHAAIRALGSQSVMRSMMQITAQARRIAKLDVQLEHALRVGQGHSAKLRYALRTATQQVRQVMDRVIEGKPPLADWIPKQLRSEIANLKKTVVLPPLKEVDKTAAHLDQWMGDLKSELAEPLDAARALAAKAQRIKPQILIVDDDDTIRRLLMRTLAAEGYEVECVPNAFAALRWLQSELPDLILMDVKMPYIDGIALTRRLKEIKTYADIPVVMISGHVERKVIAECRAAGAADFVVKPFLRDVLLDKLKRAMDQHQAVVVTRSNTSAIK